MQEFVFNSRITTSYILVRGFSVLVFPRNDEAVAFHNLAMAEKTVIASDKLVAKQSQLQPS
ncbi:MAG: hypothetical protein IJU92_04595 [Spirochaetaceae bacterium]|nr:hypothetical protein [Spirochaetaceae bacterium]